jgi:hypothetical protein
MGKSVWDFSAFTGLAFVCLLPLTMAGAQPSPKTSAELAESACAKLSGAYASNAENATSSKTHLAEWAQLCNQAAHQTCDGADSLIQTLRGLHLLTCKR